MHKSSRRRSRPPDWNDEDDCYDDAKRGRQDSGIFRGPEELWINHQDPKAYRIKISNRGNTEAYPFCNRSMEPSYSLNHPDHFKLYRHEGEGKRAMFNFDRPEIESRTIYEAPSNGMKLTIENIDTVDLKDTDLQRFKIVEDFMEARRKRRDRIPRTGEIDHPTKPSQQIPAASHENQFHPHLINVGYIPTPQTLNPLQAYNQTMMMQAAKRVQEPPVSTLVVAYNQTVQTYNETVMKGPSGLPPKMLIPIPQIANQNSKYRFQPQYPDQHTSLLGPQGIQHSTGFNPFSIPPPQIATHRQSRHSRSQTGDITSSLDNSSTTVQPRCRMCDVTISSSKSGWKCPRCCNFSRYESGDEWICPQCNSNNFSHRVTCAVRSCTFIKKDCTFDSCKQGDQELLVHQKREYMSPKVEVANSLCPGCTTINVDASDTSAKKKDTEDVSGNATTTSCSFNCSSCAIAFSTEAKYKEHILSKKHLKKANYGSFKCTLCELNLSSKKDYDSHMSGKRHAEKVLKQAEEQNSNSHQEINERRGSFGEISRLSKSPTLEQIRMGKARNSSTPSSTTHINEVLTSQEEFEKETRYRRKSPEKSANRLNRSSNDSPLPEDEDVQWKEEEANNQGMSPGFSKNWYKRSRPDYLQHEDDVHWKKEEAMNQPVSLSVNKPVSRFYWNGLDSTPSQNENKPWKGGEARNRSISPEQPKNRFHLNGWDTPPHEDEGIQWKEEARQEQPENRFNWNEQNSPEDRNRNFCSPLPTNEDVHWKEDRESRHPSTSPKLPEYRFNRNGRDSPPPRNEDIHWKEDGDARIQSMRPEQPENRFNPNGQDSLSFGYPMPANEDVLWREGAIIPERPESSLDVCDVGSPQSKSVAINWNELKEAIDLGKSLQEEQQRKIDMDIERIQEELHLKDSAEIEVELERMEANVKSLENKKKLIMKAESRSTSHSSGKFLEKPETVDERYCDVCNIIIQRNHYEKHLNGTIHKKRLNMQALFDDRKMFVGCLPINTTHDDLYNYFSRFGELTDVADIKLQEEAETGGFIFFSFITFRDPAGFMAAFTDCPHTLHDEIIIVRLIEKNLTSLDLNDGDLTRLCLEAYEKKEALKFKLTEGVTIEEIRASDDEVVCEVCDNIFCRNGYERHIQSKSHKNRVKAQIIEQMVSNGLGANLKKRKMFIGNISKETTADDLHKYFSRYGYLTDLFVRTEITGKGGNFRPFGFITFRDLGCIEAVMANQPHILNKQTIEPKPVDDKNIANHIRLHKLDFDESFNVHPASGDDNDRGDFEEVHHEEDDENVNDHDDDGNHSDFDDAHHVRNDDDYDENSNDDHNDGVEDRTEDGDPGKMFVGRLAPKTRKASLYKYFSRYGDVTNCVVIKNRQIGFVTFRDPACIAAVLQDEPHTLDGHNVNPEFDAGSGNRRRRKRNLPLDDLGHDGTRGEKRKFVAEKGEDQVFERRESWRKKSRISRTPARSRTLESRSSRTPASGHQSSSVHEEEHDEGTGRVFVSNIAFKTKEADLSDYFSRYGELTDWFLLGRNKYVKDKVENSWKSKVCAIIAFRDPAIARDVIRMHEHLLDGRTVIAQVCRPKKEGGERRRDDDERRHDVADEQDDNDDDDTVADLRSKVLKERAIKQKLTNKEMKIRTKIEKIGQLRQLRNPISSELQLNALEVDIFKRREARTMEKIRRDRRDMRRNYHRDDEDEWNDDGAA